MDSEQLATICDLIAGGKSLRNACKELGLRESTVRYHLYKDEEAFAHSTRARELGCDALADECLEIADNKELEPADRRVRIETRIRLIGKWSQRYSDKLTVNTNKTVTHRYDLDGLPTEQLEQLEGILAVARRNTGDTGEAVPSSVH